jgi:CRP-like cAMP-binding protein
MVMASGPKWGSNTPMASGALFSAPKGTALAGVPATLGAHATVLRTRRGQALALAYDGGETAFIVRSGVLILEITLPAAGRQVAALLFPGDLLRSRFAPPQAKAALVSADAVEVWRMRSAALEMLAAGDAAIMRYLDEAIASRIARQAIHAATLGRLDSEQRLATLLVELALRTGVSAPGGGVVVELPFNRKDIADYLGLNPDTLSRIMSRFKAMPLVSHLERNRVVIEDFGALAALTPAAGSLMAISGVRQPETTLDATV